MSEINGKVVAITGASSGIGEATAVTLATAGAKVVLGARRSDRLEPLAKRLRAAVWRRTDVRRREDLAALGPDDRRELPSGAVRRGGSTPRLPATGFGHVVNVVSTAGLKIVPTMSVYAATKNSVRTFSEGLRLEAGPNLRVTVMSPGYVSTNFADSITSPTIRAQITENRDTLAIPPEAIANAIAFAITRPANVDVGDIVVRPTAQA
jgi:NADP-dependent 3-hydroxy acid dehydrogenase YdfG